jgi:hypothetical protein
MEGSAIIELPNMEFAWRNFSHDSRSLGQDLNPEPLEKVGRLPTL